MAKDRSSEADEPSLLTDRTAIAEREAENALRQFDFSMGELSKWLKAGSYVLKPSTLLKLNRYALEGLSVYAGVFRPAGVMIKGSEHQPVQAAEVPAAVEELCEYVTTNWKTSSALHLSAYVLWRLNWIHPFVDGNGRTARAASYLVLCAKVGGRIPGKNTIPEQIALNKDPYYKALEDADSHYRIGKSINVIAMEKMLDAQLAAQLLSIHGDATGNIHEMISDASVVKISDVSRQSWFRQIVKVVESHPVIFGGIFLFLVALMGLILGK